ncbi:MAG TPA: hypothetical protein VNN20_08815 [Thermodesulfobacteriota bacterium]|jgi:hypothetical protein|nr:hypothetical protein [Thermodesulfobacteriota bacterium]
MKRLACTLALGILIFSSTAFAQGAGQQEITVYDPADAIHPFKLASLVIRPPVALLNIFIKGGYWVLDSKPIRGAFDIDYQPRMSIDEDY